MTLPCSQLSRGVIPPELFDGRIIRQGDKISHRQPLELVLHELSACSKWFYMNSHTCIIKGGADWFVSSPTLKTPSSLLCKANTIDSSCFAPSTTFLRSCNGRFDRLVEPNIAISISCKTQAGSQVVDHVMVVVDFWFELQLPRQIPKLPSTILHRGLSRHPQAR